MLTAEQRATKRKRTGEGTGCLAENQNACEKGTVMPDIVSEAGLDDMSRPGDSSIELSPPLVSVLRQCVVSLASFIEGTMLFGCTGMFIPPGPDADATSVLTSASLVRSSDDESKITDNLTIKVRLPDDLVVIGWLYHYDLKHDIAVVNIKRLNAFRAPSISSRFQSRLETISNVVAVGRGFHSGMLKTSEMEIDRLIDGLYELDTAMVGRPLFCFNGSFAGMNCHGGNRAVFLPRDKIIECLEHLGIRTDINPRGHGIEEPVTIARSSDYSIPDEIFRRDDFVLMQVLNSFEDEFMGDVWSEVSQELSSTFSECVVALASFNEGARHFACTGIFIDHYPARILTSASLVRSSDDKGKIYDNLRIEVCLQNKSRVQAILKYCNLRYNIAVVDIICFRSPCAIELETDILFTPNIDVVAVGRCFKGCRLMATRGVLVDKLSKLDCKELETSTCKITKAGIGGPLIDACGNFVGMNFYDEEETPYLPRKKIQELLRQFNAKGHGAAEVIDKGDPYRWPVPEPYWDFHPRRQRVAYCG